MVLILTLTIQPCIGLGIDVNPSPPLHDDSLLKLTNGDSVNDNLIFITPNHGGDPGDSQFIDDTMDKRVYDNNNNSPSTLPIVGVSPPSPLSSPSPLPALPSSDGPIDAKWVKLHPRVVGDLPQWRYGHNAVSSNGSMWITMGYWYNNKNGKQMWLSDTWRYSITSNWWLQVQTGTQSQSTLGQCHPAKTHSINTFAFLFVHIVKNGLVIEI